ncbi:Ankyrin_repeat-containing protein [Hexamita inflata]|uniref:Ankyrin repeat-containing protein n=1 Tax=Hexamita inflata TaxID=28002 RepID=A0AA86REC2_9EUKA|nr:Ankyrin repeat-containing protein [Hexamita inflata]
MQQDPAAWFRALDEQDEMEMGALIEYNAFQLHTGLPTGDGVMYCAYHNKPRSLRLLLEYFSQSNTESTDFGCFNGISALMLACMRNAPACVEQLIFQKQLQTPRGVTASMFAAVYNAYECLEQIIAFESGYHTTMCVLNMPPGTTALQMAIRYKSRECVELLLGLELLEDFEINVQLLQEFGITTNPGFNSGDQITLSVDSLARVNSVIIQIMQQLLKSSSPQNKLKHSTEIQSTCMSVPASASHIQFQPYQTPNKWTSQLSQSQNLDKSELKQTELVLSPELSNRQKRKMKGKNFLQFGDPSQVQSLKSLVEPTKIELKQEELKQEELVSVSESLKGPVKTVEWAGDEQPMKTEEQLMEDEIVLTHEEVMQKVAKKACPAKVRSAQIRKNKHKKK